MATDGKNKMRIMAVIERGKGARKSNWWTPLGAAFQNRDGSWNLVFDLIPADLSRTTIQLRPWDEPRSESAAEADPAPRDD